MNFATLCATVSKFEVSNVAHRVFILTMTIILFFPFGVSAADAPTNPVDAVDQAYLTEYHQRAVDKYEAFVTRQISKTPSNDTFQDWGGELFLAEYEQKAREKYTAMLAMRERDDAPAISSASD